MARLQCPACDGIYRDVLADGTRYFHTCPPIVSARVQRLGAWHVVPLADVQPTDVIRVQRGRAVVETTVLLMQPDDQRLDDRTAPRPNARNENVKGGPGPDASAQIAPGADPIVVPDSG